MIPHEASKKQEETAQILHSYLHTFQARVPANATLPGLGAVLHSNVLLLDRQAVQAGLESPSTTVVTPSDWILYPSGIVYEGKLLRLVHMPSVAGIPQLPRSV